MVFTSYSACYGSFFVNAIPRPSNGCLVAPELHAQANGPFGDITPIRLASITDGLSHTLFVAEKSTTRFRDLVAIAPDLPGKRGWYLSGNWGDTLLTSFYPPNTFEKIALLAADAHAFAASSQHDRGFNALMGDGSVRFIKDTIDSWSFDPLTGRPIGARRHPGGWWEDLPPAGVWQALGTRSGGEIIAAEDF
ncbi:hypothetical protein BH23PLA1_BH23PLA1_22860 [soil metagenome]